MKIIKDGRIVDVWIGQCDACKAVIEAQRKELEVVMEDNTMYIKECMYCKSEAVLFFRVNTKEAKAILRKSGLKTFYKPTKEMNGIYTPGMK